MSRKLSDGFGVLKEFMGFSGNKAVDKAKEYTIFPP
jgi:hypothetical protein